MARLDIMNNQFRYKAPSAQVKSGDWKGRIWRSNLFSAFLILLLLASFLKVGKEIMLRLEIKKEINSLQVQLDDLEGKKAKMDQLISYLKTDEYIETQARAELNLTKPGEKQVNLVGFEGGSQNISEDDIPNIQKWFNYFFD